MNKSYKEKLFVFLSVFLLSVTSVCAQPTMLSEDKEVILNLVDDELLSVEKHLLFIEENKSAVWAQGDLIFYNLWLQGLKNEQEALYEDAIRFYEQAYKSGRYEVSGYAVLLPLGRACHDWQQR